MTVFYYPRPKLFRTIIFYVGVLGLCFLTYSVFRFSTVYNGGYIILNHPYAQQFYTGLRLAENSSEPQLVLLLTYNRGGSSYLGETFNRNPLAWYWHEPLDGAIESEYGTQPGWAVPSDIQAYPNGTLRVMSEQLRNVMTSVLRNVLLCNLYDLPTEVLFHKYMFMGLGLASFETYTKCINYQVPEVDANVCSKYLQGVCPQRFMEDPRKSSTCTGILRQYRAYGSVNTTHHTNNVTVDAVQMHLQCLDKLRHKIEPCIEELTSNCQAADIRAVKTTRANMKVVSELLSAIPKLKVIHMMRDPRAVALSRHHHSSYYGLYSHGNLVKEADLYCRNVILDNSLVMKLRNRYPDTFYQIFYEHFAVDPVTETEALYAYLQRTLPDVVSDWLIENNQEEVNNHKLTSEDAQDIVDHWKRNIPDQIISAIDNVCDTLYLQLGNQYQPYNQGL